MEQVLVNVCKNALEAVGAEGEILLELVDEGGRLCLTVEDSGPGLDPTAHEHLFTPFFSTKENGQGIGLMVVQEVLSRHGFDFALESGREGGARFSIYM